MKKLLLAVFVVLCLLGSAYSQQSNRGFYRGGLSSGFILVFVHANGALAVYTFDQGQWSSGGGTVSNTGFFSFNTVNQSKTITTPVSGTLASDSVSGSFTPNGLPAESFTATKVPIFGPTDIVAGRYFGVATASPGGATTPFTVLLDSQSRIVVNGIGTDSISSISQQQDGTLSTSDAFGSDLGQEYNEGGGLFQIKGPNTNVFVRHGVIQGTFAANGVTYQFRASKESSANHLANISTRGPVTNTPRGQLISGFIIINGPKLVFIRALGPTLGSSGVPFPNPGQVDAFLPNPMVQLYKAGSQNPIAVNDDWQTNPNAADIGATTIPPNNTKEAALLVRLESGQYTAVVSSADSGGAGIALVEVYEIDRD